MARKVLWFLFKAAFGGVVSYIMPRLLVALGVPLDRWIITVAGHMSPESALWAATAIVALVLFFADRIWHHIQVGRNAGLPSDLPSTPHADEFPARAPDPPPTWEEDWDRMAARSEGRDLVARDKGLSEALAYAITGQWGGTFMEAASKGMNDAATVLRQFRQQAHDQVLTVWGKPSPHGIHEKIRPEFWTDHQPEWFGLLRGRARTEATEHGASADRYSDLMVSRAEFEKEWGHGRHKG